MYTDGPLSARAIVRGNIQTMRAQTVASRGEDTVALILSIGDNAAGVAFAVEDEEVVVATRELLKSCLRSDALVAKGQAEDSGEKGGPHSCTSR